MDGTAGPDGRVVLAIGDPDKAEHTGVYVPGTTAELDKVGGDIERVVNLWTRAGRHSAGPVSTIVWIGYDAPDAIVADAPRNFYAEEGAPRLRGFVDGLRVAHGAGQGSLAAFGHSYGSVVVGEAAKGGGLHVDDIVVAGSPGMHVARAGDLGIGSDHVWAQAANGDPVPELGRPGHGRSLAESWLGGSKRVPSDPEFGGRILSTDTHGHSDYWNPDTKSLDNQARVLTQTYADADETNDPEILPRLKYFKN
ncbi:hypothetical protein GCM10010468_63340 [Actinocorallia longicatena]|uniref:DUF1023 domain-containing protein n=1 Tax=Actinocorallia longicatena TaxID=111803 RepID=A0ABP6QHU2_9ACTN